MELPDVGRHCGLASCRQLDFLPSRCSRCHVTFCADHANPQKHSCQNTVVDVRVPTCPICNEPVPVARGEDPNLKIDQHIAAGCSKPQTSAGSTYMNKCSHPKCKNREAIRINCATCKQQFCLSHRFERDHACPGKVGAIANSAAHRAATTNQKSTGPVSSKPTTVRAPQQTPLSNVGRDLNRERLARAQLQQQQQQQQHTPSIHTDQLNGELDEDAALAFAIQQSLAEEEQARNRPHPPAVAATGGMDCVTM